MNKFKAISLIVLAIFLIELSSEALIVNYGNNNPSVKKVNIGNNNPYNADLNMVEEFLFGKTYSKENNNSRLNRIENKLFNRSYPTMNVAHRMNNVLANYRGNYYHRNYYNARNNYYRPRNTIRNRVMDTLVGRPTGFTPSITNSPYLNRFGPSYSRGYYGNNGWGYHNSFRPTMTGAGIHILN